MLRRLLLVLLVAAMALGIFRLFVEKDFSLLTAFRPGPEPQPQATVLAGGVPVYENSLKNAESDPEVLNGGTLKGANNALDHIPGESSITGGQRHRLEPAMYPPGGSDSPDYHSSPVPAAGEDKGSSGEAGPPELPIAGRVESESGDGIQGIGLVAAAQRLFSSSGEVSSPRSGVNHRARADSAGWFEFHRLPAGEYEIRTEPNERFPAARIQVRTGTREARILLAEARDLKVTGTVRDPSSAALAGAMVRPIGQGDGVLTDSTGNYALTLRGVQRGTGYLLDVSMSGYQGRRLAISEAEVRGIDEVLVDVELEPVTDMAEVSGSVTDTEGRSLSGAQVRLYSPGSARSYRTLSGASGDFVFQQVAVGGGYQLWVRAGESYKDHVAQPLEISAHGLKVPVVLESAGMASLSGRLLDARGMPVPWLGMWLRSVDSAAPIGMINSDGDGYFYVDNLREGELRLQTHMSPYLVVSGISVAAGVDETVELTLDVGDLTIRGQVTDEQGIPLPGAEVSVSWSFQTGPLSSRSSRRSFSDSNGSFVFAGLGPGIHALSINADGFQSSWVEHDPLSHGEDILVALATATP